MKDELGEYIRDCFDTLFYYMAMLYHYTGSGLLHADDVAYPLEYYIPLLGEYYSAVSAYLARNKLTRTERFLAKYNTWREPGSIAPKPPAPAIEQ